MSRGAKEEPGSPLSGVPFGVRDPVKLSSQPYRFRDGMQVRQRKGARGEKKSHLKKKMFWGKKRCGQNIDGGLRALSGLCRGLHSQHISDPDTDFPGGRRVEEKNERREVGK